MAFTFPVVEADRRHIVSTLGLAVVAEALVIALLLLVLFSAPRLITPQSAVSIDLTMDSPKAQDPAPQVAEPEPEPEPPRAAATPAPELRAPPVAMLRADPPVVDPLPVDRPPEPPVVEPPIAEPPEVEPPKVEPPKVEPPKVESPPPEPQPVEPLPVAAPAEKPAAVAPAPPPKPVTKPRPVAAPKAIAPAPATRQDPVPSIATNTDTSEAERAARAASAAAAANAMDIYSNRVNAAIQAAVVCPMAAQNMNMSGRTRVQFNLLDSVATEATVVTTSGKPMLDTAALTAVQRAKYPMPPAEFAGQTKAMHVTVVLKCGN